MNTAHVYPSPLINARHPTCQSLGAGDAMDGGEGIGRSCERGARNMRLERSPNRQNYE